MRGSGIERWLEENKTKLNWVQAKAELHGYDPWGMAHSTVAKIPDLVASWMLLGPGEKPPCPKCEILVVVQVRRSGGPEV